MCSNVKMYNIFTFKHCKLHEIDQVLQNKINFCYNLSLLIYIWQYTAFTSNQDLCLNSNSRTFPTQLKFITTFHISTHMRHKNSTFHTMFSLLF